LTNNGWPTTAEAPQAKNGSGTVPPAPCAACSTLNSSMRPRLDGMPVAPSVRSTRCCRPAKGPPTNSASNPQFSRIAPPDSSAGALSSTLLAPLALARKRASRPSSNGGNGVAAIDREDRAGHRGAGRRRQEQQGAIEIGGLADAFQR